MRGDFTLSPMQVQTEHCNWERLVDRVTGLNGNYKKGWDFCFKTTHFWSNKEPSEILRQKTREVTCPISQSYTWLVHASPQTDMFKKISPFPQLWHRNEVHLRLSLMGFLKKDICGCPSRKRRMLTSLLARSGILLDALLLAFERL